MVYLLVYVDDIILTGNNSCFLNVLIKQLSKAFKLKDLGDLHYFLGLQITRTTKGLFLHQAKYAHNLLVKHNMLTSKLAKTPWTPHLRLVPDEGSLLADPYPYHSLVGSLHYLTFT